VNRRENFPNWGDEPKNINKPDRKYEGVGEKGPRVRGALKKRRKKGEVKNANREPF